MMTYEYQHLDVAFSSQEDMERLNEAAKQGFQIIKYLGNSYQIRKGGGYAQVYDLLIMKTVESQK